MNALLNMASNLSHPVEDDGQTTSRSRKRQVTIDDLVRIASRTLFTPGVTILIPLATALCSRGPPSRWFSPSWSDWQIETASNCLRDLSQLVRESRSLRLSLWCAGTVLAACEQTRSNNHIGTEAPILSPLLAIQLCLRTECQAISPSRASQMARADHCGDRR